MPRIVFLVEGLGPYRIPFWNALSRHCELILVLMGWSEKGRTWRVNIDRLQCKVERIKSKQLFFARIDWALYLSVGQVRRALERLQPDALIIGGWASPGYWEARAWGRRHGVPLVLWSESHILSSRTHGWFVFDSIKKYFLRAFDAFYAFSPLGAEYLHTFGVDPERLFRSYNLPNIEAFPRCDRLGVAAEPTLLYVGRLNKQKGLLQLFAALARITGRRWKLLIAGVGPLEETMRRQAAVHGFADRVEFLGYVSEEGLNDVYRRGDVLLFPTLNEVWGLVLHEALLSGVYAVASDRAAATHALVRQGNNGEIVSPQDVSALSDAIERALDRLPFDRGAIRSTVSQISVEGEVVKLMDAVRYAQSCHARDGRC